MLSRTKRHIKNTIKWGFFWGGGVVVSVNIFSDNSLFFLTLVYEKGIFVGIFSFIIRIKQG